jgi:hypothetical protein
MAAARRGNGVLAAIQEGEEFEEERGFSPRKDRIWPKNGAKTRV